MRRGLQSCSDAKLLSSLEFDDVNLLRTEAVRDELKQ